MGMCSLQAESHSEIWLIYSFRSQIEKAFTGVFADIDKLIEAQMRKTRDQGLSLTVSRIFERVQTLENILISTRYRRESFLSVA